ncbi:hypothetical protein IVB30_41095 [Bradyrhizobium sp. 200]|uniref:DUF677 domain-containing protein n=1 Tax=Bradyrhizobium sp. 200 TaxID=2782665 RepID=UPI001FFE8816|nr:DUF677 domain-containing protein [Bradyrhizobium sp. 200]UPJ49273.1 hypothetical protein IVB30_41095 [Bradyrhizobium sp. 200]
MSPAIEASRWAPAELEPARRQAIFVNVRPARGDMEFNGQLLAVARESIRELSVGNALIPVMDDEPVTLTYHDPDGSFVFLPLPIVAGWDTQVFIVLGDDGKPSLSTASVSMREAGTGFDPSDGLIDAYERAIADLATDGPSPDGRTMNALLSGRFRNPLYCLVGAHFQVRKISRSRMRSKEEFDVLDMAIENLARLFGPNSPDVIALRLRRKQLSKADRNSVGQEFVAIAPRPPLLAVSFEAFVEATTGAEGGLAGISAIAVGLEPNSPWTCWRWRQSGLRLSSGIADPEGNTVTLSLTEPRLAAEIEEFWRTLGYAVTNKDEETGSVLSLRGERSEIVEGVAEQTLSLLTVPEWLVEYVREIIDQSARTGVPVDMATLVRRTGMPANLLSAAHFLMRLRSGEHREPLYNSFSAT